MMKRTVLTLALLVTSSGLSIAQVTPFNMAPEKPAGVTAPMPLPTQIQPDAKPQSPVVVKDANSVSAESTISDRHRRNLLPFGNLSLTGETDSRRWVIYLTQKEASASESITIGYQNSILISPESSHLSLEVNGVMAGSAALDSPDNTDGRMTFKLHPGVLKPGENLLSLAVQQTHRTDCTIQSTYDLWTRLDPANTYLTFNSNVAGDLTSVGDIAAVGLDDKRVTSIEIVAPALDNPTRTEGLLRLSQALALRTNMPNEKITIQSDMPSVYRPGSLIVLFGTTSEISGMVPSLPIEAQTGPSVAFVAGLASLGGLKPLVISAPTAQSLQSAIDTLAGSRGATATDNSTMPTSRWRAPDAPILDSETRLPLAQLGVKSEEFSGRRFRTGFLVAVPSDFYAQAYGEAQILLDAAYSAEVLPGSQIDIYVNDQIASTVPISVRGGGIFRHLPIKIPMRHFVSGTNKIDIEAVLHTAADATCAPGAPKPTRPRFALFDTSEFSMPNFARLGITPNLAATNSYSAPYNAATTQNPTAIYLSRLDTDTFSAAATLVGRLATGAGHVIPLEVVSTPAAISDRDGIMVGAMSEMSTALLMHLGISTTSKTAWHTPEAATRQDGNQVRFEDWKAKVNGGVWQGNIGAFGDWMQRNFNITSETLRFLPSSDEDFAPSDNSSFMIAQGRVSTGKGILTLITAPTAADLKEGMAMAARGENWHKIAGRISTIDTANTVVETVAARNVEQFATQPFSLSNWRLIAANWFSSNISIYAFTLGGFLVALGLVTHFLLGRLGRRN
ncbi:cellulose biosynthesis cyclic di-GMP-binding regulatory protein BcsB [Rhizobium sp.]|jgi:cellulose synthase operon protein B|uniref:cellulose biosynthesis cyclic di-GMP-binding regulatory protein BcsB n=1 Tax=Rhizobium sp. TaxID=391 RepID=UPI000E8C5AC2|nr:cellulose synthase BcsB subunit [Rhizobium sp.]